MIIIENSTDWPAIIGGVSGFVIGTAGVYYGIVARERGRREIRLDRLHDLAQQILAALSELMILEPFLEAEGNGTFPRSERIDIRLEEVQQKLVRSTALWEAFVPQDHPLILRAQDLNAAINSDIFLTVTGADAQQLEDARRILREAKNSFVAELHQYISPVISSPGDPIKLKKRLSNALIAFQVRVTPKAPTTSHAMSAVSAPLVPVYKSFTSGAPDTIESDE